VFGQIAGFLIDTVVAFFAYLLLARFLFQWLRVPFHNPVGEFIVAITNWMVVPLRRILPGIRGLDLATLLLAWLFVFGGIWLQVAIAGAQPSLLALAAVSVVDLARYMLHILVFAIVVLVVVSWVESHSPVTPVFDTLTRPFLRPLRRVLPPVGRFDLSPLVLLVIIQVLLIVLHALRSAAALL
jgi:YggT family protein